MPTDAATRVLNAAAALFSERGYGATSTADVEEAAGLRRGTGGAFRHFPSKAAMLEAVVRHDLDEVDARQRAPVDPDLSLRDALAAYARAGLAHIRQQRRLIRLLYRDLEAFPDLRDEVRGRLVYGGTREFARRLELMASDAGAAVDAEALAVILAGAITNIGVIEATLGKRAPVADARVVEAWTDLLDTYLAAKAAR
jgi:AcrR family transcriptional regulator